MSKKKEDVGDVLSEMMGEDSPDNVEAVPATGELNDLEKMVAKYFSAAKLVDDLDTELKEAKEAFRRIERQELPDALTSAGVRSFTTTDGHAVSILDEVAASIPAKSKGKAFAWLRKTGNSAMIRTQVVVSIPSDNDTLLSKLTKTLRVRELDFELKESVHPGTLKAFVRGQLEEGGKIPRDDFGVFQFKRAKIK